MAALIGFPSGTSPRFPGYSERLPASSARARLELRPQVGPQWLRRRKLRRKAPSGKNGWPPRTPAVRQRMLL